MQIDNNEFIIQFLEDTKMLFYGEMEEHFSRILKEMLRLAIVHPKIQDKFTNEVITESEYWFMVSILNYTKCIEYGTSPRYFWLNEKGEQLEKEFHKIDTIDKLYKVLEEN